MSIGTPGEAWSGAPFAPRAWQADALPKIIDAMRARRPGIVSAVMGAGKSILQAEVAWMALPKLGDRAIVYTVPRQKLVKQLSQTLAQRLGKKNVGVYYGRRKQAGRKVIVACNASVPNLALELAQRRRRVALIIADEAHGTEAANLRESIPSMEPACLLGFTATPFRSVPGESISLFTEVLYRYTIQDAVRDGVLVEPRVVRVEGTSVGPLDEVCLDMMRAHADGPGIISATGIDDAEAYAAWLCERDFPAKAIHSRQSEKEQDALIAELRAQRVRALVHVSLLAEGVDFPWLRWICLRRHVSARVRFLQEVGRVLRVDRGNPGKTDGVILDPHLLLGQHGWTTAEAIGQALEEAAEAEAVERSAKPSEGEVKEREAVALDLLLAYLRSARAELLDQGIVKARGVDDGGWQLVPVSERQVEAVKKASRLTRHIPEEHRDAIKALSKVPWALTRGEASDLLDVLFGGARWCRDAAAARGMDAWRVQWPKGRLSLPAPEPDAIKSISRLGRRVEARARRAAS